MGYQEASAPYPIVGPYMCGICAKPHKTSQCMSYMLGENYLTTRCWCQVCQWNTMHITRDYAHIDRLARERDNLFQGQPMPYQQNGYNQTHPHKEVVRLGLGMQPPPSRMSH